MSKSLTLTGALIKVYVNNTLAKEVQEISYTIDYDEYAIYGIDTPHPQEIAPGRYMVSGSMHGIRIKKSGGIQAINARPLVTDLLAAPYVSIRIQDRSTNDDLLFIPNAKISKQSLSARIKGTVVMSFEFKGLVGFEPLDRA